METNFQQIGTAEIPIWTTFKLDTKEGRSDLELSKSSGLDLKLKPALEVEEEAEDRYESAMASQALEAQWYFLVAFASVTSGSASNGYGSPGESILEALNQSGDSEDCDGKGYDSDEYDAAMKKFKEELALEELEEKQGATRQVFMTNKGDDAGQGATDPPSQASQDAEATREQGDLPLAANKTMEGLPEVHGGPRSLQPAIPVEQHLKTL
jgi:hypothetical protein